MRLKSDQSALTTVPDSQQLASENERLRARLAELEQEIVEIQTAANAEVARWQERAYWLDRWHLDLNALMRKPGAAQVRGAVRVARILYRALKKAKRKLFPAPPRYL